MLGVGSCFGNLEDAGTCVSSSGSGKAVPRHF